MLSDAANHDRLPDAALQNYNYAAGAMLRHAPGLPQALDAALVAAPDFHQARALLGLSQALLARRETLEAARRHAEILSKERGAMTDPGAVAMFEALQLAASGRFNASAERLEERIKTCPQDIVAIKLAHQLFFMGGGNFHRPVALALPHWREADAGFGFLMGCHAFSLEEAGRYEEASHAAQNALAHQPDDAWAMHALAHVHEMTGRVREGISWLESFRKLWTGCHNFAFHLAWHLALFHLETGCHRTALEIYDREIRAVVTDDFRDIANAVSFLWRLRQEGVDTGGRFDELYEIARLRTQDASLMFASLHHLLSLLAKEDFDAAQILVDTLSKAEGEQADAARRIGAPLARAIISISKGETARGLAKLVPALPLLGGSHTQRDVFLRELALEAGRSGDAEAQKAVMAARGEQRGYDRFTHWIFNENRTSLRA